MKKKLTGIVVTASQCPRHSMTSSAKMAQFVSKLFKFPIVAWNGKLDERCGAVIDGQQIGLDIPNAETVIFINSSTTFSGVPYLEKLCDTVKAADLLIYAQNDYMLPLHSRYKRAAEAGNTPLVYWSTVERVVAKHGGAMVDWNRLTYEPYAKPGGRRNGALFYYGACRPNRTRQFIKWFGEQAVSTVISVPTVPQQKKFDTLGLNRDLVHVMIDKTDAVKQLSHYNATLYIEDPYSSRNYCHPANRLYEALSAGTAVAIDGHAVPTFQRAGLSFLDGFVVESRHELRQFMKNATTYARWQCKAWHRDYIAELRTQIRREAKKLGFI